MDDWKLFAGKTEDADALTNEVMRLSAKAGLHLNAKKCNVSVMMDGVVCGQPLADAAFSALAKLPLLQTAKEVTKYLGILQGGTHNDRENVKRVRETLRVRTQQVLKLKGSSQQLITAVNSWALGMFKFSVGIVHWSTSQLNDADCEIRRLLKEGGLRPDKGGTLHLYIPRKLGGRGLARLTEIADATYIRLDNYVEKQLQWLMEAYPGSPTLQRIRQAATAAKQKVGGATTAGEFRKRLGAHNLTQLKELHQSVERAIHMQPEVHAELSRNWLAKEQLTPSMEKTFFCIKEDQVMTRKVLVDRWKAAEGDTSCRFCGKAPETLDHILSSCQRISFVDYKERHDQVARNVAKVILEKFGIPWKYEWWTTPLAKSFPLTREGKQGELQWDPKVKTVNKLEHNHPDLVVKMPEGQVLILEFAVCRDDMVVERVTDKERRYAQLARDWQLMHGVTIRRCYQ